jgi:serine protein kinase
MSKKRKLDFDHVIDKSKQVQEEQESVITLKDYLDLVRDNPKIAQTSPARLWEMFERAGREETTDREKEILQADYRYKLVSDELFGVERAVEEIAEYLKAGAMRASTAKQILLLVGPPASGKSTFVRTLIRALENYSEYPLYRIKGCPMNEDPLHALPRYLRQNHWDPVRAEKLGVEEPIEQELGIPAIKGELCPHCRMSLFSEEFGKYYDKESEKEQWWKVELERFRFSTQTQDGIGSFEPSDEKTQDVGDLVGHENIGITNNPKYGRNHPNAFWLDGALECGNRGITEGREFLKKGIDERLLWVFINVAEEQEIKVHGSSFPHISVDTVVIGHCNLTGYKEFTANRAHEALHDRIYTVPFPYPLRIQDEMKVYKKLIEKESEFDFGKIHIAPEVFRLAAIFAVLTRLKESDMGVDKMTKLEAYNGELTELTDKNQQPVDLRELIKEGQISDDIEKREGMFGVSSRDVLAALNQALARIDSDEGCLTHLNAVKSLRGVFRHRMGYEAEEVDAFMESLTSGEGSSVMEKFEDIIMEEVSKAYLETYGDLIDDLFEKYIREAEYARKLKRKYVKSSTSGYKRDSVTGEVLEPDYKFLRSVEKFMQVSEKEADIFRGEILELKNAREDFGPESYRPLRKAIEDKVLEDAKSNLHLVLSTDRAREESEKKKGEQIYQNLIHKRGFCEVCAKEAIEKVTEILSR